MLREIRLYGALAKFIGKRVLRADVSTTAEAVRFLIANWPEAEKHMVDQYYRVSIGPSNITLDELHNPVGQQTIKIIPTVKGAGGNLSAGQLLLGAALIGLSFLFPAAAGAQAALKIGSFSFSTTGAALFGIGAQFVLGGIAGLLAPTPKVDADANDPRKSFSFSGIQNTSRQGLAVPIIYGETVVGSIVASASIDIVQVISGRAANVSTSSGTKTKG